MATESPASPGSDSGDEGAGDASNSKNTTGKDRECQYCHQKFTSSSLGRHLDQYIWRKKPDGIHNVDEIRRVRGGITRRTAKNSKRDNDGSASGQDSPAMRSTNSPAVTDQPPKIWHFHDGKNEKIVLNKLNQNWQATGIISDPSVLNGSSIAHASPSTGTKRPFSSYVADLPSSVADNARALELSLREVLDTLRAANQHASPKPSPFNFDVKSQTYPALCLQLLPAPPTLFSPSPFSSPNTLPLYPPGPDQLEPLRSKINHTVEMWKWQSLRLAQPTTSNIADEADFLSRTANNYIEAALSHLDLAYSAWVSYSPGLRQNLWCIELMRACKTEQDKHKAAAEEIEHLRQEATQLQQQVEYLSKCQWPREMAQWPPERLTYDHTMREELRLHNVLKPKTSDDDGEEFDAAEMPRADLRGEKWDFDKLVTKWKRRIREDRVRKMPQANALMNDAVDAEHQHSQQQHRLLESNSTPPGVKKSKTELGVNGNAIAGKGTAGPDRQASLHVAKNIQIVSDIGEMSGV